MTKTKPNPLPGTDPTFHEMRRYYSPITHKGRKIMGHFASCKESGCGYSGTWANNKARDKGIFVHRSEKIKEARFKFLVEQFRPLGEGEVDMDRIGDAVLETSDKYTHFFEGWVDQVEILYGYHTNGESLPHYADLEKNYIDGASARETVRNIISQQWEKDC
jgi:hypothetical protein